MKTEYDKLNNCYQKSPNNIEADRNYYELSQRKDLNRNNKSKYKLNGLKAEDIKHYKHNDNSIREVYATKQPTLIVSVESTNKIAQELNLGEVKGKLSERLACRKKTIDLCVTAKKTLSGFTKR